MCLPEGERDCDTSMALEAVVYPHPQDYPFGYGVSKDLYAILPAGAAPHWSYNDDFGLGKQEQHVGFLENQTENFCYPDWTVCSASPPPMLPHLNELHLSNPSSVSETSNANNATPSEVNNFDNNYASNCRPKRRRARSRKNQEEIENQRMTHIAVERNRRKQMNEYLSVLRSLMPDSYVQRGDQASIIGGAINFVKELEQRLQYLGGQRETEEKEIGNDMPFSEFFAFPQYSTSSGSGGEGKTESSIADIEVTMVESHANVKIRTMKQPKQLMKMVSALQAMRLTVLHLNVTTSGDVVLYCISVKIEEECKVGSVEEIAAAVYQMLERIQQDSTLIRDPNFT